MAEKTRFTIDVDGVARTVFSAKELTRSGDINIHITKGARTFSAPTLTELVGAVDEDYFQACEKHISIHTNPKSTSTNTIKHTIAIEKNNLNTHVHLTTAIKQDNLYAPVLFRVCGDLSRERYLAPDPCSDRLVSLGQLNPKRDQLRFMVVVSNTHKPFTAQNEHPSIFIQMPFANFNLTVIWSFLNQPSHPQAIDFFPRTSREHGPTRGLDWWEIYNLYTDINMTHAQEYFRAWPEQ